MHFKKYIYTILALTILVILTITVKALIAPTDTRNQSNSNIIKQSEEINENNPSLLQPI